ncbi:hypothetical protein [Paraburkholderia caribensis]|uniref:hypothetical protein n=1 Tax=Paraburkholderia caribensis TaxID=75105 RepID=UPI0034D29810
MIEAVKGGVPDKTLVKGWMTDYGLFQGLTHSQRDSVVGAFEDFVASHRRIRLMTDNDVYHVYGELYAALYGAENRVWASAASKLLWCLYPRQTVIYDDYVHSTIVVLQSIDRNLAGFPRVGIAPRVYTKSDIELASKFYVNFQCIVKKLCAVHKPTLRQLRRRYQEQYPYDIRVIDKLLWMISNPNRSW